ncbi:FG-GAP-like repeat-containing protein [Reichenbachiella ulvae]|uniref:FG-GAP-like repeat-containing protein n=1 Tax=Reichenbachiella ulvae TaxID=2980104 RepID=A0ABT3CPC7_9BACT|nr:FG-GAP-like repeat-containing protein [Reichenbachiella ulvae]MCV9385426.1 FG-GAP-like repeat-containing protein [Reichenbachiella ulvae]
MLRHIIYNSKSLTLLVAIIMSHSLLAQTPYINSVSPGSAAAGEKVSIIGSNLPTTNVAVFFGGAIATDINATASLIETTVPYGATFDHVSVIDTSTGLIAYSSEKFIPTFDGTSQSSSSLSTSLGALRTFESGANQSQDLCTCDLDQDGDMDVMISNAGSSLVTVFTNTSSGTGSANASFSISTLSTVQPLSNITCGDMDGDGYPEIASTENTNDATSFLYVFKNNTGVSGAADNIVFAEEISLEVSTESHKPNRVALNDLDLDGKPELVTIADNENIIYYFENNSTVGTISFGSVQTINATENSGTAGLGGLDVSDLNNDGFPEIIVSNQSNQGFYVIQNNSAPNSISFATPQYFETQSNIRALKTGDLDNDGFKDIVLTNGDISIDLTEIAKNTTTGVGNSISFGTTVLIQNIERTWGLDLGDVDGDGDLDIAIGSIGGATNFYVLLNPGDGSLNNFDLATVAIQENSRNIKIADFDNDGRADFAFTHKSSADVSGQLGIKFNEICYTPEITALSSTELCTGESVILEASKTGLPLVWKRNGGVLAGETGSTLTVSDAAPGNYTVEIGDGCSTPSDATTVNAVAGTYAKPSFSFVGTSPYCKGATVAVNITADPSSEFILTGPNGFELSASTQTGIVVADININSSGEYQLTTISSSSGCGKTSDPVSLSVVALPTVSVKNPLPNLFCDGTTLALSTTSFPGYTYDWKLDGASFSTPETNPDELLASVAGNYSVTISGSGCSYTSDALTLETVTPPTPTITTSTNTLCEGAEIDYSANATAEGGFDIIYTWDFADGSATQIGQAISYAHSASGTYDVSVTASYDGVENCTYTPVTQTIDITATPSGTALDLIISNNSDPSNFEKCEENSLIIRVEGDYQSYEWRTIGGTVLGSNPSVQVSTESEVTVGLVDDLECSFDANPVMVSNYTSGGVSITPTGSNTIETDPDLGKIINLNDDQFSVGLSTDAIDPGWIPAELIDNPLANDVTVTPRNARTLVAVEGIDILGCYTRDSVTLVIPGVKADKSFTPNGDGINDCWQISNVSGTDCTVTIFDAKGRKIRDIKFSPDTSLNDCVWDGTKVGGGELPNGTYYYIMNCSDSQNESGGAIFMAK